MSRGISGGKQNIKFTNARNRGQLCLFSRNNDLMVMQNTRAFFLEKKQKVEGGTVSHYYILVICKFIHFMSLFRHSVWFSFSVKQFPFAEFGICNI